MLLFHGTGASNVLGVLAEGLCCAPPAATVHGHAYGKGIYFADAVDKSMQYAHNSRGNPNTNNHMIVFLAEVFLGKMDPGGHQPREGYDSVLAPNGPSTYVSLVTKNTGVCIPVGAKAGRRPELPWHGVGGFNEYVVFNPAQILIRYLVLLKNKDFVPLSDSEINDLPINDDACSR
jgi:hypothetical protein